MSDANSTREDRIQARAYALWEEDGRPEGRAERHWSQARAEIEGQDAEAGAAPATAKKGKSAKANDPHPGMMGDGSEEQNLSQEGDPSARITEAEVQDAFKAEP